MSQSRYRDWGHMSTYLADIAATQPDLYKRIMRNRRNYMASLIGTVAACLIFGILWLLGWMGKYNPSDDIPGYVKFVAVWFSGVSGALGIIVTWIFRRDFYDSLWDLSVSRREH